MLVPHHLLFFFKITNDLLETLLEQLNLLLITRYLLRLNYCSLRVLLLSSCVDVDLSLKSHIRILDSCDQLLLFVDFLPLQDRLNRKFLIFQVDLTFNLVNKFIRVRIRHFFQIVQLFVILDFFLSHFDLVFVFSVSDSILHFPALLSPFKKFQLVNGLLSFDVFQGFCALCKLVHFRVSLVYFFFAFFIQFPKLLIHFGIVFGHLTFKGLFRIHDLVAELQLDFHFFGVLR
jgi:hypothetical protein